MAYVKVRAHLEKNKYLLQMRNNYTWEAIEHFEKMRRGNTMQVML